ncbi:uncharacterized protein LOC125666360 [Ostrea edulis]|uniref:uncharacterized protein LOC125666360 n=1 Tax=Ostrea edulis TaxID=37623 RepID=UPI0024AFB611|nr:uncharacterized protein LOC125666360 [Ostrea edulis]
MIPGGIWPQEPSGAILIQAVFLVKSTVNTERIRRWSRSIKGDLLRRRVEKRAEDDENKIEPGDIQTFMQSPIYNQAEELFRKYEGVVNGALSEAEYTLMRNFVLLNTLIDNAQRVGALLGMTLKTIRYTERKGECHVLVIVAHKTGTIAPVTLVFVPSLWRQLKVFLEVRRRLPGFDDALDQENAAVFLTYPSQTQKPSPMNSSTVSKGMKYIWRKAGLKKPLSGTQLRKTAATLVRERYPDSRLLLAQQMSHRPNTQDQFYHLTQQKEDSVTMVGVISHVMRAKRTTGEAEALEDRPGPSGPIIEEVEEEDETLSLTATTSNEPPEEQHTPLRSTVLSPSPAAISSHGRRLFLEE